MRRLIRLTCDEIRPDGGAIIRRMHGEAPGAPYLNDLAEEARAILERVGRPTAVFQSISLDQLESIYAASSANQLPAPMPRVARQAEGIALFAATLGSDVDAAIRARFRMGRPWEVCMLDAFTAAACERLAQVTADQFAAALPHTVAPAFPYTPGFCGWDISGMQAVLELLRPEETGWMPGMPVTHALSFAGGVLLAAPADLHRTTSQFPCCSTCSSHRCLYRTSSPRPSAA